MPRPIRRCEPGEVFHVVTRGNKKAPIFHSQEDFAAFNERLRQVKKEMPFRLHSSCQMTNHFHMLIQIVKASISEIMQALLTWHAKYYNDRYKEVGHVFQGRFKSSRITNDAYFLEAVRYIHLNPVYAGMVRDPGDWAWSSHSAYLRGDAELVESEMCLSILSTDKARSLERYREFLERGLSEERRRLHPGIPEDARISALRDPVFDEVVRLLGTAELPSSRRWQSLSRRLLAVRAEEESVPFEVVANALGCTRYAYDHLIRKQRD